MWTRKRTVIGGKTAEDDWTILRNTQAVGRIHRAPDIPGLLPIQWSTFTYPGDRGRADTLDQGLTDLRTAIRARWPDDVARLPMMGGKD